MIREEQCLSHLLSNLFIYLLRSMHNLKLYFFATMKKAGQASPAQHDHFIGTLLLSPPTRLSPQMSIVHLLPLD